MNLETVSCRIMEDIDSYDKQSCRNESNWKFTDEEVT